LWAPSAPQLLSL